MYSAPHPVSTSMNGMGNELIDGSGTINPAALNPSGITNISSTSATLRVKTSCGVWRNLADMHF